MRRGRCFDLIIAPFRVLSHIVAIENQIRALNKVYDHLNPGGVFIFDLYVPNLKIILEGLPPTVDFDGEYAPRRHLNSTISAASDLITHTTSVTINFAWDEEEQPCHNVWLTPIRFFFRYELEHLIPRSKLTLKVLYGDVAESLLASSSKEFFAQCIRSLGDFEEEMFFERDGLYVLCLKERI
jgi:hypothetical protein